MTSKDILNYIEKEGVDKLYKKVEKCFLIIDDWSDILIQGDLLDENELALIIDQSTGVYGKLCVIVNALESYKERKEYNGEAQFLRKCEKVRTQDASQAKCESRASVSDIRDYLGDFKGYLLAAQQNIVSAQSRLKRLTVEKGARGIDFTGEVPVGESSGK
jgi:hypothetical protein